jgi:uncharacterized alkaline shock family protein YloU
MSIFNRIVSTVLGLLGVAVAATMGAVALGFDASGYAAAVVHTMLRAPWETAAVAVVILLAALGALVAGLSRGVERAVVRETSLGQVRISLAAIENAVYRSVRQVRGVCDVDADVRAGVAGVDVRLAVTVAPDLAIPAVSDEVQQRVERYVQETVGVSVGTVVVEIKAVASEARARVE